ncbi:MAG TPA: OsmC family protein [Steroidobacteraceae bacterium]|nr:OsmC family protein [Steroidobacteraceae bacterium]
MSRRVCVDTTRPPYVEEILVGSHRFRADEPSDAGGTDAGPGPYELLLAALGTCTCITVRMYAERKHWPLEAVRVVLTHAKVHAEDCVACETEVRSLDQIEMEISFTGELSDDQRQRLLAIAGKCPVHRTLTSQVRINTRAVQPPGPAPISSGTP